MILELIEDVMLFSVVVCLCVYSYQTGYAVVRSLYDAARRYTDEGDA